MCTRVSIEKKVRTKYIISHSTPMKFIDFLANSMQLDEAAQKIPTAKQVDDAKIKYDSFGLKIENAKKKAGYARGTGVVGDLQRKRGQAHTAYMELKAAREKGLAEGMEWLETTGSAGKEDRERQMADALEGAATAVQPTGEKPWKPSMSAPAKKYPAVGTLAWEKLPKHTKEMLLRKRGHTKG